MIKNVVSKKMRCQFQKFIILTNNNKIFENAIYI